MPTNVRIKIILALSMILFTGVLGFLYVESRIPNKLTISFLDIGQGDSIFIESPIGKQILIDGGADKKVLYKIAKHMPVFDRSLDVLVATHPDKDHIGGLPAVLDRYSFDMVLESGANSNNDVYEVLAEKIENSAENNNTKVFKAKRGQKIDLRDGVVLDVLYPDRDVQNLETNEASIVVLLTYKEQTVLLTGDASEDVERRLLKNGDLPPLSILKVGHHGSKSSTGIPLVMATKPVYSVISSGENNSYGHPHKRVTDLLDSFKSAVLRTDKSGSITFVTNGETISYTTEK